MHSSGLDHQLSKIQEFGFDWVAKSKKKLVKKFGIVNFFIGTLELY